MSWLQWLANRFSGDSLPISTSTPVASVSTVSRIGSPRKLVAGDLVTSLGERQRVFVYLVAKLIQFAYDHGYELSFGEAYRSPQEAARLAAAGLGITNSLHTDRLAIDLNLFKDRKLLERSEDYAALGTYWKTLHPLCSWGGDFTTRPDGNHFSVSYGGRR